MKLTDSEISNIIEAEESAALDYEGELAKKRAKLMDFYNCQPFGDEVEGQSKAVSSDVSDVVEAILPNMLRIFTQGRVVANFEADDPAHDSEAEEKTELSNYAFLNENNGVLTLHNMFKDALLQYTGTVKIYWDEEDEVRTTKYSGLSELEYQSLLADDQVKSVEEVEEVESEIGKTYNCEGVRIENSGGIKYDNIPPEEFLIARSARDFINPRFIGHRSPKTRSTLMQMGFDRDIVASLPADEYYEGSEQKQARNHNLDDYSEANPSSHRPNDIIYLGEYYLELDSDGDGITEYWKIFYAGKTVLEKEQVEDHPFAVCVPIPIPHRAIGTCPAEQVADIQHRKSHLERNLYDNVYQTNYPRVMHSNKVDLDDLLTPRAGGTIEIDTDAPDVQGHASALVIPNMIADLLGAIEYTDTARETRTGVTRYAQGLDAEALNKTATGFTGMMDASQQRQYLIARLFADGGVKQIFVKTVDILSKHQNTPKQIRVYGKPIQINPREWGGNTRCTVNIGVGSGDRQEKILNLNSILQIQERFMASGLVLSDQSTIYRTLEKLIDEVGLKDVQMYFNNPEVPEETLFAQNQQLTQMVMQLQQMVDDPYIKGETMKAQAKLIEAEGKQANEKADLERKRQEMLLRHAQEMTKLELEYGRDVPGSEV